MLQLKKMYGSGSKAVIFSSEDLNDMTKILKALEDSDVLMKGVTKTLKNDIKKGSVLLIIPMLLGTLGASLLTGKGIYRSQSSGNGLFSAGQGIKKKSLMPPYPLTNVKIQDYLKNEPII